MPRLFRIASALLSALLAGLVPTFALAHTGERAQVMLLPTGYYIVGGALAVLASVVLVAILPQRRSAAEQRPLLLGSPPFWISQIPSLATAIAICVLIADGILGSSSPVDNPLPGAIWGLFWFGLTAFTLIAGNLWPLLNPWRAILYRPGGDAPLLSYPARLGKWPAVIQFFAFAWVELVDPRPADPPHLALLAAAFLVINLGGARLFGLRAWLANAEPFSAYFRLLGMISPVHWSSPGGVLGVRLAWPGQSLVNAPEPSVSEAAFILLVLAAVSFDGLSQTFLWVGHLGLNPLEFPGRSAVIIPNTLGLAAMAGLLALAFATVARGYPAAKRTGLAWPVAAIAVAYHLAHYLPDAPLAVLRALRAVSDPFGTGLNLFGTGGLQPPASLMMDRPTAQRVYRAQTGLIVAGHIAAVVVGHLRLARPGLSRRAVFAMELPLNALMIAYTLFGLWLLSTPVMG